MSQKKTSQQSKKLCENDYDHTNMTVKWGFNEEHEWTTVLYGCSRCEVEPQKERFPDKPRDEIDHSKCDYDPCFGCKAKGLQIATGDASKDVSNKSFQNRLDFYAQAKKDGIQPGGTHPVQVEAAYKASEKLGKAYDAGTMVRADKVTKRVANTMKDMGK